MNQNVIRGALSCFDLFGVTIPEPVIRRTRPRTPAEHYRLVQVDLAKAARAAEAVIHERVLVHQAAQQIGRQTTIDEIPGVG